MKSRTFLAGLILAVSLSGTACATRIIDPVHDPKWKPVPPPAHQNPHPGYVTPPPNDNGHRPPSSQPPYDNGRKPPQSPSPNDNGHRLPPPTPPNDNGHRPPHPPYYGPKPGNVGTGPVQVRPPQYRPDYVPEHHKDVPPAHSKPYMPPTQHKR